MKIPTFREFLGTIPLGAKREFFEAKYAEYLNRHYPSESETLIWHPAMKGISLEDASKLSFYQAREYNHAGIRVNGALNNEMVNLKHLEGRVLDFGFGFGGSLALLATFSEDVTGIEVDCNKCWEATKLKRKINKKPNKIVMGDGIEYMTTHEGEFDLITAFNLGYYDTPIEDIEKFILNAYGALKSGGKIIITSDPLTMENVQIAMGKDYSETPTIVTLGKS